MEISQVEKQIMSQIRADFRLLEPILYKSTSLMLKYQITEYPVIIIASDDIQLGVSLPSVVIDTVFQFRISFLEELVKKNIILPEKVSAFKHAYRNPQQHACLFVYVGELTRFIFIPYQSYDG